MNKCLEVKLLLLDWSRRKIHAIYHLNSIGLPIFTDNYRMNLYSQLTQYILLPYLYSWRVFTNFLNASVPEGEPFGGTTNPMGQQQVRQHPGCNVVRPHRLEAILQKQLSLLATYTFPLQLPLDISTSSSVPIANVLARTSFGGRHSSLFISHLLDSPLRLT